METWQNVVEVTLRPEGHITDPSLGSIRWDRLFELAQTFASAGAAHGEQMVFKLQLPDVFMAVSRDIMDITCIDGMVSKLKICWLTIVHYASVEYHLVADFLQLTSWHTEQIAIVRLFHGNWYKCDEAINTDILQKKVNIYLFAFFEQINNS